MRDPVLRFIADLAAPLGKLTTNVVADPRPVGGSMFRIYRDTRFSKDKTPYKKHVSAQFRHRAGKDVHGAGATTSTSSPATSTARRASGTPTPTP